MSYAAYLERMPQELLEQIAGNDAYVPWLERGESLPGLLASPSVMETVYNRMSRAEKKTMALLLASAGSEPFEHHRLERAADGVLTGAEVRAGLIGLLHKGIVIAFRKSWGEHIYLLPQEGLAVWQPILLTDFRALPAETIDARQFCTLDSPDSELNKELFFALSYCFRHRLPLTKSGTLHKKTSQKLAETFRLDEGRLGSLGLNYAYSDTYPLKLALAAHFFMRLGLLRVTADEWKLHEAGCIQWLGLSPGEQRQVLYRHWKTLVFPEQASLQHAAILLERLPEGEWLDGHRLVEWLGTNGLLGTEAITPENALRWLNQFEQRWVQALLAFGWMEIASDAAGCRYYRWINHPCLSAHQTVHMEGLEAVTGPEASLYVQPDFDILVPPDTRLSVCWELESFADRSAAHPMLVYRLTKESLQRAMETGKKVEAVIGFLQAHAAYGVPDNVEDSLLQWSRPFAQARFNTVLLLRCADAAVAADIMSLPGVEQLDLEKLGEKDLLVPRDKAAWLGERLDKAGYMPGTPEMAGDEERPPAPLALSASPGLPAEIDFFRSAEALPDGSGLIYSRTNVTYFEPERRLPDPRELYPELPHIPAIWLKEYRSYHPSTRKVMVEKAIEWKALLQLRRAGEDRRIVPRKVQETRGTWCLKGWEQRPGTEPQSTGVVVTAQAAEVMEVAWLAEDWQEMKLILPGINEK